MSKWMNTVFPEKVGIPSERILAYIQALDSADCCIHGICLIRHGQIAAEVYYAPFDATTEHRMYSSSKSMASIAIGLLQDEGKCSLDDSICVYFQDKQPDKVHPWIQETTLRDMLMMSTCFVTSPYEMIDNPGHDWIRMTYECPPSHRPGQFFSYDTSVATMMAAIVESKSGMHLMDYLRKKLAPLELSAAANCVRIPDGSYSWAGSGVLCTLRDFAKLGLFSLNHGEWEGQSLISREYMDAATSKQIDNGRYGYGYQFWRTKYGFAMLGMGNQVCYCLPDYDLVLAVIADQQGQPDKSALIEQKLYEILLPALSDDCLEENPEEWNRLKEYTSDLAVRPNKGNTHSSIMDGKKERHYEMIPNAEGVQASLKLNKVDITFGENNGMFSWDGNCLKFGLGYFEFQDFPGFASKEEAAGIPPIVYWYEKESPVLHMPCMVSGAWLNDTKLELLCYAIGDFLGTLRIQLSFEEDYITIQMNKFAEKFWSDLQGFQSGKEVKG